MGASIASCAAGYVSVEGPGGARVSSIEESPASAGACKHPLCDDLGVHGILAGSEAEEFMLVVRGRTEVL